MSGGLLSFLQSDPGAAESTGILGGMPMNSSQKAALLFAGLRDAVSNFSGRDSNNLGDQLKLTQSHALLARKDAVNQRIREAYATGDMNAVRSALLDAEPDDIAHISGALTFGQPKYQDAGGGLYSIPTIGGGKPQQVVPPKAAAPTTRTRNDGQNQITEQWDPQTQTWTRVGIAPRFKTTVAKPDATYVPPWQR